MSDKELKRLSVLQEVCDQRLTQLQAAQLLHISTRQIRRLLLKYKAQGPSALAHAGRGHPSNSKKMDVKEPVKVDSPISAEVLLLRQQIDILKNQLDDAKDRESFYQNQIKTMQRLLEAPKTNMTTFTDQKPEPDIATDPRLEPKPKYDGLTTADPTENPRISVPEHIEPEPEKRGFWSRFFKPNE